MDVIFKDSISPEEMNGLRAGVGFRQIAPEQLELSLAGSRVTAAYEGDRAVAMARLIWDGGMTGMITDVLVLPGYRGRGLEERLVSGLLEELRGKLEPGFGIQIDVKAWGGQREMYEGMGFVESTVERRGMPMHICLTEQIELTDRRFGQMGFSKGQCE